MEDRIDMTINGEDFEATPDNTVLFTFAGQLALYNHIFIIPHTLYLFERFSPSYSLIKDHMAGFPAHLNLRAVSDVDKNAFESGIAQLTADLDHVEDWHD